MKATISVLAAKMWILLLAVSRRPIFKFLLVLYFLIELLPNDVITWTAQAFVSEESKQLISGTVLRVLVLHYPPMMMIKKNADGTMSYRGVSFDILNYIGKALDISYEYVHLKPEDVRRYGIAPAQVNAILNDEADIAPCGVQATHSKYQLVDFSVPFLIESLQLVVPWPEEDSDHLIAAIRPFQPMVWLCIGLSVVAMDLTITFLIGVYKKYINKQNNVKLLDFGLLGRNFVFVWSHLTNHSYFIRLNSRRALVIVVGIWCLMTIVLANAYAGCLLSFMSVKKLGPIINSLDELALSKDTQLVIQGGTEITDRILDANATGTYKLIGDSLRKNPENILYKFNQDILKEKMMNGSYATIHVSVVTRGIVVSTYRENGNKCRLTIAKKPVSSFIPIVQLLRKNSPYTKAISQQILELLEAGVIDYIVSQYVPQIDQCLIKNYKPDANYHGLNLWNMSFAFVILGIGIGMAAWSFVFEFLYKQIKKKRQQQVGGVSGDHRINVTNSINSKTNNQDKSAAAPVIGGNAMERGQVNKVNDSIKKTKNEEKPVAEVEGNTVKEGQVENGKKIAVAAVVGRNIKKSQLNVEGNRNVIIDSKKQQPINLNKSKSPVKIETLVVVDIEDEPMEQKHKPIEETKTNGTPKVIEKETIVGAESLPAVGKLVNVEIAKEPPGKKTPEAIKKEAVKQA